MNQIVPDKFNVDGNLVIRIEQESLIALMVVVIFIIVVYLIASKMVNKI